MLLPPWCCYRLPLLLQPAALSFLDEMGSRHRITPEARAASGITEGLLRVAVGLEDIRDIIADLQRGLGAA